MNNRNEDKKDTFLQQVKNRAILGAKRTVEEKLSRESRLDVFESKGFLNAKKWYAQQNEGNKHHITALVEEAILEAVFGMMVVLDSAVGTYPILETRSDYALYVQTYENSVKQSKNEFDKQYRINGDSENLHDLIPKDFDEGMICISPEIPQSEES